jgi:hypothetical protein
MLNNVTHLVILLLVWSGSLASVFAQSNKSSDSNNDNQQESGRAADPLLGLRLHRGSPSKTTSTPNQPPAGGGSATVQNGYVILTSPTTCKVYLDGKLLGSAQALKEYEFSATVGEHVVEVVTLDKKTSRWRTAIQIEKGKTVELKPRF